jgi:hypothetical protein
MRLSIEAMSQTSSFRIFREPSPSGSIVLSRVFRMLHVLHWPHWEACF